MPIKVRKFNAQVRDPESGQMVPAGLLSNPDIESVETRLNNEISRSIATDNLKVNIPLVGGHANNGTDGQLLRTKGNGQTEWTNEYAPTSQQVQDAVDVWMEQNPNDRALIDDGSITDRKIANSAKSIVKYSVVSGKTLNEIFSVYDTVIVDTNINISNQNCDYPVKFIGGGGTISIAYGTTFNSSLSMTGCNIYNPSVAVVGIGELYLDNCDISGTIRFNLIRNIKNIIIKNCYMHDLTMSTFHFIDYAFENIIIEDNVVEGFASTLFNIGTNNENNIDLTTRKMVIIKNNYIDGIEEQDLESEWYYTPFLVENDVVYMTGNVIKNITDNYEAGNPTYSAYLSSRKVEFTDNYIENVHSLGTLYNTFMKSKSRGYKYFANNYFKDDYTVSLFSSEAISEWVVENCIFEANTFKTASTRSGKTQGIFRNCKIISNNNMYLLQESTGLTFDSCSFIANTLEASGARFGAEDSSNPSIFKNCTFECKTVDLSLYQTRIIQNTLYNCQINTTVNLYALKNENCYMEKVFFNISNSNGRKYNYKNLTIKAIVPYWLTNAVPFIVKATSQYSNIVDWVKVTLDDQTGQYLYNGSTTPYVGEYIAFEGGENGKPYFKGTTKYNGLEKTIDFITL